MTGKLETITRFSAKPDGSCSLCNGRPDSIRVDDFSLLLLDINPSSQASNIMDLLKDNFDSTSEPFSRRCELCQNPNVSDSEKQNAFSMRSLPSKPDNLFIQIPKFDAFNRLIGKLIVPELELQLGFTKYSLVAMVSHEGDRMGSGHYVCHVRGHRVAYPKHVPQNTFHIT